MYGGLVGLCGNNLGFLRLGRERVDDFCCVTRDLAVYGWSGLGC